ncbi:MAG: tetratricopeptide repeat protein [Gemmatimonadaceae bacterium]
MQQLNARSRQALAAAIILLALSFAAYSNGYRHAYHLDDAYTLVNNPSIRSLDAIPRYFVDPGTYTSLREQADYRPILQITYALNYRMGDYDSPWWHGTQVLLHALVAFGVFAFARRVLTLLDQPNPSGPALVAAAIFAIHPAASGVVNYFNARSSLLTALFLLPALLAYMSPRDQHYDRPRWRPAFWLTLAIFTKVEAVGVLGAFWAFELWQRAREKSDVGLVSAMRASFDARTLRRMAPALAVTALYFVIRWRVMAPFPFDETRHAADVGAYEYFLTQWTAWWHYVARWVAPVNLVADDLAYPVYRSLLHPVVLLALGGWLLVAMALIAAWKRAPHYLFLAIVSLALLSPTSSVAPLAEMVNEHRPYLPVGLLVASLIAIAAARLRTAVPAQPRRAIAGAVAIVSVALGLLTYQRNEAFATPASYWRDVLDKAPSARAHLNYGLALAGATDLTGALDHYRESLRLAPNWYYTHINLGIVHWRLGQMDSARTSYDRAVANDRYSGHALTWRGEFRLSQRDFAGARDDFLASNAVSLDRYRNTKGLATAYAGLGDVQRSLEATRQLLALDSATAVTHVASIAAPYFEHPGLRTAGIQFYRGLEEQLRGTWWIPENITRLQRLIGATQAGRPVTKR